MQHVGIKIGVLALQGAFAKHVQMLASLGIETIEVRSQADLERCDGLILPGGESTTMLKLNELSLQTFERPIFGTCAGLILMAKLGLLDVTIARNAYGRQCASFSTTIDVHLEQSTPFHAIFIRAPKIASIDSPAVRVLSQEPVIVQQGNRLATSFHPELTKDPLIHHYFVQLCKEKQSLQPPSKVTPTKSFQMT